MKHKLTPALITALSALVVALDHNRVGGAYLVALTAMLILSLARSRK